MTCEDKAFNRVDVHEWTHTHERKRERERDTYTLKLRTKARLRLVKAKVFRVSESSTEGERHA